MTTQNSDRRRAAHIELDSLLDQLDAIADFEPIARRFAGSSILFDAAAFVGSLVKPETLISVYGATDAKDRASSLSNLANRLSVASGLFKSVWLDDGHSIADAAKEAQAVANGDVPHLFRRLNSQNMRTMYDNIRSARWLGTPI